MTETMTPGQTILLRTRTGNERVVYLGQNYDGTEIIIGHAGSDNTETVAAEMVLTTEQEALELAAEAYGNTRRTGTNREAWKRNSIKALNLANKYREIAGLTIEEADANIRREYASSEIYR